MQPTPPHASDEELAAALLVLEQEGPAALSVEHVARRLGRRGGAAAMPWPDPHWLRSELGALGFRRLRAAVAESVAEVATRTDDPGEQLLAAGRAYVRTAVRSPRLFTIMYERSDADFAHPDLGRDASAAFAQLRTLVESVQRTGFQPDRTADEVALLVWDSVHRLTVRWADAALDGPVDPEMVEEAINLEMTLVLGDFPRTHTAAERAYA